MLTQIPYRPLKRLLRAIRIRYFTVDWPEDVPTYETSSVSPSRLEEYLREREGYEGMYLSYHYEGEELNLRRPAGVDDEGRQVELHIRGRMRHDPSRFPGQNPLYAEYIAHLEPSRYEHKQDHIEADDVEWLTEDEIRAIIGDRGGEDEP